MSTSTNDTAEISTTKEATRSISYSQIIEYKDVKTTRGVKRNNNDEWFILDAEGKWILTTKHACSDYVPETTKLLGDYDFTQSSSDDDFNISFDAVSNDKFFNNKQTN